MIQKLDWREDKRTELFVFNPVRGQGQYMVQNKTNKSKKLMDIRITILHINGGKRIGCMITLEVT